MNSIQFINTTPEELINKLGELVDEKVNERLRRFKVHNDDEILTLEEAAGYLKVNKLTLHRWRKKGIISAYRIGNQVRYKKSELLTIKIEKQP